MSPAAVVVAALLLVSSCANQQTTTVSVAPARHEANPPQSAVATELGKLRYAETQALLAVGRTKNAPLIEKLRILRAAAYRAVDQLARRPTRANELRAARAVSALVRQARASRP